MVLAPVLTVVVFALALDAPWPLWTLAWIGAASAGVAGTPAVFWVLDRKHPRTWTLVPALAAAAVVPLLAALLAGEIGQTVQAGPVYAVRVLGHGAPLPGYGLMPWRSYLWLGILSMVIGALTGVLYLAVARLSAARARS
jgi:hypothetical protein